MLSLFLLEFLAGSICSTESLNRHNKFYISVVAVRVTIRPFLVFVLIRLFLVCVLIRLFLIFVLIRLFLVFVLALGAVLCKCVYTDMPGGAILS